MLPVLLAIAVAAPVPDATALEPFVARQIPAGSPVVIARGETVLLEVVGPLREVPDSLELDGKPAAMAKSPGVSLLPWVEQVSVRPGKRSASAVTQTILRVDPRAPIGPARVSARIDIVEQATQRNVAIFPLEIEITIAPALPSISAIERAKAAFVAFDTRALSSARLITTFPVERLEMPARAAALSDTEKLALRAFLVARLRADSARDQLRAAADNADDTIATAAITALASFADPLPKPGSVAPPPLTEPVRALDQGIGAFERWELDLASRFMYRARMTPALPSARVPDALVRLGAIEAARGNEALATDLMGQALCLNAALASPSTRPPIAAAFAEVKRRARCAKGLAPHSTTAAVVTTPEGPTVVVRSLFGPDPYHAIERGTVELLDAAGSVSSKREVFATRGDLAALGAEFEAADIGDVNAGLRVRARAYDAAGIELSRTGDLSIPIAAEPERELEIKWWMWAAGGAAVFVGGVAIIAAASGGGDPARAIGPVAVRF